MRWVFILVIAMTAMGCGPQLECVSQCLAPPLHEPYCGDGITQDPESCDIDDFTGNTCASFGLTGELQCTDECALDMSGCK